MWGHICGTICEKNSLKKIISLTNCFSSLIPITRENNRDKSRSAEIVVSTKTHVIRHTSRYLSEPCKRLWQRNGVRKIAAAPHNGALYPRNWLNDHLPTWKPITRPSSSSSTSSFALTAARQRREHIEGELSLSSWPTQIADAKGLPRVNLNGKRKRRP